MTAELQAVEALEDRKLGTAAAALFLDVHPVTLRKWRCAGIGPRWEVLPGGRIRYSLCDLRSWAAGKGVDQ